VIDVAAYTWDALTRLADMANFIGDDDIVPEMQRKANQLAELIRNVWWLEDEGLYADVRASVNDVHAVLARLAETTLQNTGLPEALKQAQTARRLFSPYLAKHDHLPRDIDLSWLLRHWVVLCPVEVNLATPLQAARVLKRLLSDEYCNDWGMYLHPERHDVMSINTGLLALSAARYGHVDAALDLIGKLTKAFSYRTPGSVAEALPDKWCFLQLWSNVGLVSPIVECFLGIEPRAGEKKLRVMPNLPTAWNQVEVRRLRIGDVAFDIRASREDKAYSIGIIAGASGWTIQAGFVLPSGTDPKALWLNGQPGEWRMQQTHAGSCVVCDFEGDAELIVEVDRRVNSSA